MSDVALSTAVGIPSENIIPVGGRESDGSPSYIGPWTFQCGAVRDVVEDAMHGRVLNACAGKTHLSTRAADEIVRNDLNPERDAHYHHDVTAIDEIFAPASFDTVVFDPPFDQTQADEHYESMHDRQRGPARRKLAALVRPGGTFIELGWNLHGPADQSSDWDREPPYLFRRGPSYQPVFLVIDQRTQAVLTDGGSKTISCPQCDWENRYKTDVERVAVKVNAELHWEDEHGGRIPDDAAFGGTQCPDCLAMNGLNGTSSCSECGYIPPEVRL